ncbi:MAG: hypothetical protein ACOX0F_13720 [Syntrophomonadaceae bacterium]
MKKFFRVWFVQEIEQPDCDPKRRKVLDTAIIEARNRKDALKIFADKNKGKTPVMAKAV